MIFGKQTKKIKKASGQTLLIAFQLVSYIFLIPAAAYFYTVGSRMAYYLLYPPGVWLVKHYYFGPPPAPIFNETISLPLLDISSTASITEYLAVWLGRFDWGFIENFLLFAFFFLAYVFFHELGKED